MPSLTFAVDSIMFGQSGHQGAEIAVNPVELAFALAGAVGVVAAAMWRVRSLRSEATRP
jgi:hypothetical protein